MSLSLLEYDEQIALHFSELIRRKERRFGFCRLDWDVESQLLEFAVIHSQVCKVTVYMKHS